MKNAAEMMDVRNWLMALIEKAGGETTGAGIFLSKVPEADFDMKIPLGHFNVTVVEIDESR